MVVNNYGTWIDYEVVPETIRAFFLWLKEQVSLAALIQLDDTVISPGTKIANFGAWIDYDVVTGMTHGFQ